MTFYDDLGLPAADPAPSSGKRLSLQARRNKVGARVIRNAHESKATTLDEAAEVCGDATTNASGTLCGRGVGGRGGFQFWRDRADGSIRLCQENIVSAARGMTVSALRELIDELGTTGEEFAAFVKSLPSARD